MIKKADVDNIALARAKSYQSNKPGWPQEPENKKELGGKAFMWVL